LVLIGWINVHFHRDIRISAFKFSNDFIKDRFIFAAPMNEADFRLVARVSAAFSAFPAALARTAGQYKQ
jgi:hypothetical protein